MNRQQAEIELKLNGKAIIIFDDIFDSRATIKEIGNILTRFGFEKIVLLVIAKTVGGIYEDNEL